MLKTRRGVLAFNENGLTAQTDNIGESSESTT